MNTYLGGAPVFDGFVSGGERHFLEVSKRLNNSEYKTSVMTVESGYAKLCNNGVIANIYLVPLPFPRLYTRSLHLFYLLQIVKSVCLAFSLKKHFTVVSSTSHFIFDLIPAVIMAKIKSKSKLIVYLHHLSPSPLRRSRYNPMVSNVLMWLSDRTSLFLIKRFADLIFVFPHVAKTLVDKGVRKEKIAIMNNGIDLNKISESTGDRKGYDACFLGRIAPLKGVFDIVEIWDGVCAKMPDTKIAIIGFEARKEYLSQLNEKIVSYGLQDNIAILGPLSEEDKYATLKSSKIFIFPSYEEGWGIAVCEAMACGLPVVAYDLKAYDVFDGGVLRVPEGDKIKFTEMILRLFSEEEFRLKMSEKAKIVAERFDWNRVAEDEKHHILSLAAGH